MFSSRARYSSGVKDCLTAIKTFTIPKLEDGRMFVVIICDSWLSYYLWLMFICGHYMWFMIVVIICDWCVWSLFVIHDCCHYLWFMIVVIIYDSWLLSLFVIDVCGHYLWFMIICGHYLWFMIVCCQYFAHCGCCLVPRWRDSRNARYVRRWGLRFGRLCCWCCGAKSDVAKDLGDPRG